MCSDEAESLNQTAGPAAVRWANPGPCPVPPRTLPAVLEDGGRTVSVNAKVVLALTPEGHALSDLPGVPRAERRVPRSR